MLTLTLILTNEETEALIASAPMKKADEAFRNSILVAADDPRDPAALAYQAWRKLATPLEQHVKKLAEPVRSRPRLAA